MNPEMMLVYLWMKGRLSFPVSGNGLAVSSNSVAGSPSDFLGEGFSTAYNIGNMSGSYTFTWTGTVNANVPTNYYRFQLSSNSNFNLSLTGMSAEPLTCLCLAYRAT